MLPVEPRHQRLALYFKAISVTDYKIRSDFIRTAYKSMERQWDGAQAIGTKDEESLVRLHGEILEFWNFGRKF